VRRTKVSVKFLRRLPPTEGPGLGGKPTPLLVQALEECGFETSCRSRAPFRGNPGMALSIPTLSMVGTWPALSRPAPSPC
jgi:hypothetical protein